MNGKAEIIRNLEQEIMPLQGHKPSAYHPILDQNLAFMASSFPNGAFPLGAIHELLCDQAEQIAASAAFALSIAASLLSHSAAVYIYTTQRLYPPALQQLGIAPERVIYIRCRSEKEALWATEQALRCSSLAVVLSELKHLDFTQSRRLQLAVEQSNVTGFLLRTKPALHETTTSIGRWVIHPISSEAIDDLPGVGSPAWHVQLVRMRNGRSQEWDVVYRQGSLYPLTDHTGIYTLERKKAV